MLADFIYIVVHLVLPEKQMAYRLCILVLMACMGSLLSFHAAHAQITDQQRAISHMDAARALIKQNPPYSAARQYAEFIRLEHLAGREDKAREGVFMLLGLANEDQKTDKDLYIHLIAQAQLDQGKTDDAMRSLERIAKSTMTVKNLQLEVTKQLTRRFGLQRGVTYARQAFPDHMTREDVYCKLCYTLTAEGQAKTAGEFIEITFDLIPIYRKLDAYRFAAFGMHTAGKADEALAFMEEAQNQAKAYPIATTRVSMLSKLAVTFDEIGQAQRGLQALSLAEAAAAEIEPDNYQRDGEFENIAEASAMLGQRERALQWIAKTKSKRGTTAFYKGLIEQDLLAGNPDRARQLSDEYNVYFGSGFEVRAALAKLERGDAAGALAAFNKLSDDLVTSDWHREAAAAFARKGQHAAIKALLGKIKDDSDRFNFHLGAAEGYLGE